MQFSSEELQSKQQQSVRSTEATLIVERSRRSSSTRAFSPARDTFYFSKKKHSSDTSVVGAKMNFQDKAQSDDAIKPVTNVRAKTDSSRSFHTSSTLDSSTSLGSRANLDSSFSGDIDVDELSESRHKQSQGRVSSRPATNGTSLKTGNQRPGTEESSKNASDDSKKNDCLAEEKDQGIEEKDWWMLADGVPQDVLAAIAKPLPETAPGEKTGREQEVRGQKTLAEVEEQTMQCSARSEAMTRAKSILEKLEGIEEQRERTKSPRETAGDPLATVQELKRQSSAAAAANKEEAKEHDSPRGATMLLNDSDHSSSSDNPALRRAATTQTRGPRANRRGRKARLVESDPTLPSVREEAPFRRAFTTEVRGTTANPRRMKPSLSKSLCKTPRAVRDITKSPEEMYGVSVHHLASLFLDEVLEHGHELTSTVYDIEDLTGPPGLVRQKGQNVVCPIDGKMGAAYVHCLKGSHNVGPATHMLSYTWGYKIGDIVGTLIDFCKKEKLNPESTYFWICFLCVNQHRVVAGDNAVVPTEDFLNTFGQRVSHIRELVCMMAPWEKPAYLERIWCIYEMSQAFSLNCKVNVALPPGEKLSLIRDLLLEMDDTENTPVEVLYEALDNIKVEEASASQDADRKLILDMLENEMDGADGTNKRVRVHLKEHVLEILQNLGKQCSVFDAHEKNMTSGRRMSGVGDFYETAVFRGSCVQDLEAQQPRELSLEERLQRKNKRLLAALIVLAVCFFVLALAWILDSAMNEDAV